MKIVGMLAVGLVLAGCVATQEPPATAAGTRPIDCAASPLELQKSTRCSVEASTQYRSREVYRASGAFPGGGGFAMNLYLADRGSFVTEGAPGDTERYLRNFSELVKNEARNWSAFDYEDGILYATFEFKGSRCAVFSRHGPPAGGGYQWLLAGTLCPATGSKPFDELKQALRFTRVGQAAGTPGATDAFGRPIAVGAIYAQ